MPDGPWIWSSWSERSLCPTVHESEALGQEDHYARRFMNMKLLVRKFIMSDGPWIWSSWSEKSLCPTVHLSEALSVKKFNMPDGPWIGSCWSERSLCPTVHESEALCQKDHYARWSICLKLYQSGRSLCPTVHEYEALGQKNHYARRSMNLKLKLFLYLMVHFTVQSSENLLCPKFHRSKVPSVASLVLRFIGVKLQWSEYLHIQVAMACLSWHDEMSISSFFITMRHVCIVCKFAKFILFIF
jgi:hypothetical protein